MVLGIEPRTSSSFYNKLFLFYNKILKVKKKMCFMSLKAAPSKENYVHHKTFCYRKHRCYILKTLCREHIATVILRVTIIFYRSGTTLRV